MIGSYFREVVDQLGFPTGKRGNSSIVGIGVK